MLCRWDPSAPADNGKRVVRVLIGMKGIVQAHSPVGAALDPDAAVRSNQVVNVCLEPLGHELKELPAHVIGCEERGVSRAHRYSRAEGPRIQRADARVRGSDPDILHGDAQLLRHNLADNGLCALPDVRGAGQHVHATLTGELDHRARG